jgi:hypothetical protein
MAVQLEMTPWVCSTRVDGGDCGLGDQHGVGGELRRQRCALRRWAGQISDGMVMMRPRWSGHLIFFFFSSSSSDSISYVSLFSFLLFSHPSSLGLQL